MVPGATMAARNTSVLGLVSAVKSGVGIGLLPTALGDAEPDLLRVLPVPELARSWRLLCIPICGACPASRRSSISSSANARR